MQEEKIKQLAKNVILELAPQEEVWESKKILDLLKKPKGEERTNFWRDALQIDMQSLPGKTAVQKEKSLIKAIEDALLPCLEILVEEKKVCMLYELNNKKLKTKKYTLAFPWESYQIKTEEFLAKLREEQKQHLAQLTQEQQKLEEEKKQYELQIAQDKAKQEEEHKQILAQVAQERENIKEEQKQHLAQLAQERQQQKEEQKQHLAQLVYENKQHLAQMEAAQEQNRKEWMEMVQKAEQMQKEHIQFLREWQEKMPSMVKNPLADAQEFLKKIQASLPKAGKKQAAAKTSSKKSKKPAAAPKKQEQEVFAFSKPETNHEISLEEACEKLHKLYSEMRILQKYPVIKIHLLRRELKVSRELFDQAIETLARQKKIDLLQATNEEDFERDERRDAYYDSIEDRIYYFIQWR